MSSKRRGGRGQDDDDEEDPARRLRRRHQRHRHARRKHLYLVLDDWNGGFSVHKMGDSDDTLDTDDSDDDEGAGGGGAAEPGHLPEPPLLRLESPAGSMAHRGHMSFSAIGTKMFASVNHGCALVYDTETAVVSVGPHAPAAGMVCGLTVTAGGMLYALSYRYLSDEGDKEEEEEGHPSFHAMGWQQTQGWSWNSLPVPPPTFTIRQIVVSHALHPDGCTIFMTTACQDTPGDPLGTYSFNTKHSEWRYHGDWALPFRGQGYFDGELDAWIGLHRDGYICSCQVASRSGSSSQLDWQMTKEKLLAYDDDDDDDCKGDRDMHASASLTYMDMDTDTDTDTDTRHTTMDAAKFCLVETMVPPDGEKRDYCKGDHQHGGYLLRVTTFGLKYNRRGELHITNHRSTRSYLVSNKHKKHFVPFALWI